MDALPAQGLKVLEDTPYAGHGWFQALHMHGVGAEIDIYAERVFHQPDVFVAGPEQGLKIGSDLQSDLQRFRWPPDRRVEGSWKCGHTLSRTECAAESFKEERTARANAERMLRLASRNRGLALATKSGIWA